MLQWIVSIQKLCGLDFAEHLQELKDTPYSWRCVGGHIGSRHPDL